MRTLQGSKYVASAATDNSATDEKKAEIEGKIKALVPQDSSKSMTEADVFTALEKDYIFNKNEHIPHTVFKAVFDKVYGEYEALKTRNNTINYG